MNRHRTKPGLEVSRRSVRGFTLTELMVVVVIMSILAIIGTTSFRAQMNRARLSETKSAVQAIAGAQRTYYSEHSQYLDVSNGNFAADSDYYPTGAPGKRMYQFNGWTSHEDFARWDELRPPIANPVMFGYSTTAGLPGDPFPAVEGAPVAWPTAVQPWFVIQGRGNLDGDAVYSYVLYTSFSPTPVFTNEGE